MRRVLEILSNWIGNALAVLLILMVLLLCLGVALRYIWGVSLLWADETLVFAMVGMVFVGAIGVSHRDQHLRMSLLTHNASRRVRRFFGIFEQMVTVAVCLFVAHYSFMAVSRLSARGTLSNMAEIPLWLIQGTVLVGLVGMALVAAARLWDLLTQTRRTGGSN